MAKIIRDVEQPRSGLAWSYNDYKPSAAKMTEKFTIEEQRAEYINLYYEAQERLQDLREAGYDYADVVKTTVLLDSIADFAAMNAIYATYFTAEMPARMCYEVAKLPMGAKVEIDAVAAKK